MFWGLRQPCLREVGSINLKFWGLWDFLWIFSGAATTTATAAATTTTTTTTTAATTTATATATAKSKFARIDPDLGSERDYK